MQSELAWDVKAYCLGKIKTYFKISSAEIFNQYAMSQQRVVNVKVGKKKKKKKKKKLSSLVGLSIMHTVCHITSKLYSIVFTSLIIVLYCSEKSVLPTTVLSL